MSGAVCCWYTSSRCRMVSSRSSSRWKSSPPQSSHVSGRAGGSNSTCQTCPHRRQVRRPDSRLTTSSSSTTSSSTMSSLISHSMRIFFRVSACGTLRGKPSSRKPACASVSCRRLCTIAIVTSSGTRSPRSMNALACLPSSVPVLTLNLKMSPVEILGIARCEAMNWACVPLPAPGGPTRTTRTTAGNPHSCAAATDSRFASLYRVPPPPRS